MLLPFLLFVGIGYGTVLQSSRMQATISKQLMGLLVPVWLAAHVVVMHRSPVYQAIHDRAARTWVAAPEEGTQLRIA